MVISYSVPELYAIGEMMCIRELLAKSRLGAIGSDRTKTVAPSTNSIDNNIIQSLFSSRAGSGCNCNAISNHNSINNVVTIDEPSSTRNDIGGTLNCSNSSSNKQSYTSSQSVSPNQQYQSDEKLTSSVADFFRKAQQNFYPQVIDPTKVRRLSDIEAELVTGDTQRVD